jgi:hypothetical protein
MLIRPAKAPTVTNNSWETYWHESGTYGASFDPVNLSTAVLLSDVHHQMEVGVVVMITSFGRYDVYDSVVFRAAVYVHSTVDDFPTYKPEYVTEVDINVNQNATGTDLEHQCTSLELGTTPPGFNEGFLLEQKTPTNITLNDKKLWAEGPLFFLGSQLGDDAYAILTVIDAAEAFAPEREYDFHDANWTEAQAWYDWKLLNTDLNYFGGTLREYGLNVIRWFQTCNLNPVDHYGLTISPRIFLRAYNNFNNTPYIDMTPITLTIHHSPPHTLQISTNGYGTTSPSPGTYTYGYGSMVTVTAIQTGQYAFAYWTFDGSNVQCNPITVNMNADHSLYAVFLGGWGGGCPTLLVWNSSGYNDFGVINIHNPDGDYDVIKEVPLPSESVGITNYVAKIRLREGWEGLNYSHSAFDQVKLYAVVGGIRYLCPLFYGNHSTLGNVLLPLMFSDDWKVDAYLMETVDLKFLAPYQNVQEYVFVIEGINHLKQ